MLTWVDFTRETRQEIAWKQLFTALDCLLASARHAGATMRIVHQHPSADLSPSSPGDH